MKTPRLLFCLAALTAGGYVAANPRRSSARYEIVPETMDGGGGRSTSADYELVLSLTPGGRASSSRYLAGAGYAAQLSDSLSGPCQEYLDWSAAYFPDATDPVSLPEADDDHDGAPNVIEFAFNLNPLVPDGRTLTPGSGTRGLPVIRTEIITGQQRLTIEYIRRRNSCAACTIEASADLETWSPVAAAPNGAAVVIDAEYERVKFNDTVTLSATQRRWLCVRVTVP